MPQHPQTGAAPAGDGRPAETDTIAVLAGGLRNLSRAEIAEIDRIITPRAAALLAKAFGNEVYRLMKPLTRNDGPSEASAPTDPAGRPAAGEPGAPAGREPAAGPGPDGGIPTAEAELRALMRDPRYWRDKDPQVMDRVAQGFRRLYPD